MLRLFFVLCVCVRLVYGFVCLTPRNLPCQQGDQPVPRLCVNNVGVIIDWDVLGGERGERMERWGWWLSLHSRGAPNIPL